MKLRGWLAVLTVALSALLLPGCASLKLAAPPAVDSATDNSAFSLRGRLALREHDRNLSGGMQWQHNKVRDDILLLSPLGQGVMQITRDANGAVLRTSDDKTYSAPDAEELAYGVTGWRLPVAGLSFWIRGVPREGAVIGEQRDNMGRLSKFTQDDWTIEVQAYFDAPDDSLPRRVLLTRPEFELRLVIDDWEQKPATPAGR